MIISTHVFDIRARVNSNDITMLDTKVVANNTVHASTAIIQLIVCKDDQDSILALLSLHQDSVTTEQL